MHRPAPDVASVHSSFGVLPNRGQLFPGAEGKRRLVPGVPLVAVAPGVTGGVGLRTIRDFVAGIPVVGRAKPARGDPLFQFLDFHRRYLEFSFHLLLSWIHVVMVSIWTAHRTRRWAVPDRRLMSAMMWIRLGMGAHRDFRSGTVALPRGRCIGRARGDALLQLFDFECFNFVFHFVSPPFCFGFKGSVGLCAVSRQRRYPILID